MPTPHRLRSTARTVRRQAFNRWRLILAVKTAAAAAVAWYFAPWVPFADAEYSYYAPLGVLVSMYPTLADSARASVQAVLGLALGIGGGLLGILLVTSGVAEVIALAAVVGVSVALGGIRALGAGRDWIAIAALFVLLVGAADPDGFSSSYLLTMAFGVVVGLVTNLVIVPPIYLSQASNRLSELRDAASASLDRIAADVRTGAGGVDTGPELTGLLDAVAADVREAERSRRGNPLGWRRRGQDENVRRLRALDDTVRASMQLAVRVDRLADEPEQRRHALADLVEAASALVAAPIGSPEAPAKLSASEKALAAYTGELGLPHGDDTMLHIHATAAVARIIDASRPLAHD